MLDAKRFRYLIKLDKSFVDSTSAEAALKELLETKGLRLEQTEIPTKKQLICSVTKTPNAGGVYSAVARLGDETIATADAPSPERALRALGFENPSAHTCRIYRQRFGDMYELVLTE